MIFNKTEWLTLSREFSIDPPCSGGNLAEILPINGGALSPEN